MHPPDQTMLGPWATLAEYEQARDRWRAIHYSQGNGPSANCATGEQMTAHYREPGPETLDEWLGRLFD